MQISLNIDSESFTLRKKFRIASIFNINQLSYMNLLHKLNFNPGITISSTTLNKFRLIHLLQPSKLCIIHVSLLSIMD